MVYFNPQNDIMTFYRYADGSKTSRNSRIYSLFATLGIKKERIYEGNICDNISKPIDYDSVDAKLRILRESSIDFLKHALTLYSR